jgi:hypothetical protein
MSRALFVDVVSSYARRQMTYLSGAVKNPRVVPQTDAPRPSRGSELLSALSQLKHWNVRISGDDRDELLETSVIGARQFEQG